jgi:hypothetical protein
VTKAKLRYEGVRDVCGQLDHPGLATDLPIWVDHTRDETTVDQARIEDVLETMDLAGRSILHVGVGNSGLASRFAPRVELVDGLTVSEPEMTLANSLGIPNYTVQLLSKYSREFLQQVTNRYDYVVDNNLASFACCKYHFFRMLDNYLWCMRPRARILTDQRGMDFTVDEDPRWQLTYDDLVALEDLFPVTAGALTDTVYELRIRSRVPIRPCAISGSRTTTASSWFTLTTSGCAARPSTPSSTLSITVSRRRDRRWCRARGFPLSPLAPVYDPTPTSVSTSRSRVSGTATAGVRCPPVTRGRG